MHADSHPRAALLCCVAAVNDDESPIEKERARGLCRGQPRLFTPLLTTLTAPPSTPCNEQPVPLFELPATPLPLPLPVYKGDEPVGFNTYRHHPSRISDRPPSIKPLELDETPLISRWSLIGKSKPSPTHAPKPSISSPYGFRKLDVTEPQRQGLKPLKLGPVVLRESPVPPEMQGGDRTPLKTTQDHGESTEDLLEHNGRPRSYRLNRDTPFQRCQQRSSTVWPLPPPPPAAVVAEPDERATTYDEQRATRPRMVSRSSSGSLRRSPSGDVSSGSSISSRPSNERIRPRRKRSQQFSRKSGADQDDEDLEKEVMELNTIVEERRAENSRGNTSDQHVAAIAPSMKVRARAETLDAIGSAFSRPLTAQSHHRTQPSDISISQQPTLRRSASATLRTSSRVSGWLSGIFPASSTAHTPGGQPFYKCQPRPRTLQRSQSENSMCSSGSDMDSPSLTAASSPTSKGHSRSHTGESRILPISPASTAYEIDGRKVEDRWPVIMTPTSQVGLAL